MTGEVSTTVGEPPQWFDYEAKARHVGRSFGDTHLEDTCPCPKEPCGLVRLSDVNSACSEHPIERAKSLRQGHAPENCPDAATAREAAGRRLYDAETVDTMDTPHWRELFPDYRETWIVAAARSSS